MLERCLATPAVHVVEVPIDYTAGAALQVRLDPSQAIAHASKQTLVGLNWSAHVAMDVQSRASKRRIALALAAKVR